MTVKRDETIVFFDHRQIAGYEIVGEQRPIKVDADETDPLKIVFITCSAFISQCQTEFSPPSPPGGFFYRRRDNDATLRRHDRRRRPLVAALVMVVTAAFEFVMVSVGMFVTSAGVAIAVVAVIAFSVYGKLNR